MEITAVCSIDSLTTVAVGDINGGMHGSDAVVGLVGGLRRGHVH